MTSFSLLNSKTERERKAERGGVNKERKKEERKGMIRKERKEKRKRKREGGVGTEEEYCQGSVDQMK